MSNSFYWKPPFRGLYNPNLGPKAYLLGLLYPAAGIVTKLPVIGWDYVEGKRVPILYRRTTSPALVLPDDIYVLNMDGTVVPLDEADHRSWPSEKDWRRHLGNGAHT